MPNRLTRALVAKALVASACLALPASWGASALAEKDRESARSVVQIRCISDQGESKATGFVWPERGSVVTALHAVAACPEILVFSEPKREQTRARVTSVLLEADLALLQLEQDLGIEPIAHLTDEPNTRGDYYIWGYPLVEEEMSGKPLDFADGWKGGVTSLGSAFESEELHELFDAQNYPTEETKILRVASTIQPGHSGAPIISTVDGRVVAIADGGLEDGWRGVNWSIPAHIYLAKLQGSDDDHPTVRPDADGLFSQTTAVQGGAKEIAVKAAPGGMPSQDGGAGESQLVHVRSLSLDALDAIMKREGDDWWGELVPAIHSYADHLSPPPDLSFDIYEDFVTGSTIGVPAGLEIYWDDEIGALAAFSDSNAVALFVAVFTFENYEQARDLAPHAFFNVFSDGVIWSEDLSGFAYSHQEDDLQHANFAGFYDGKDQVTGEALDLQISLTVSGPDILGYAVLSVEDQMQDRDWVHNMMMQLGAAKLSDFAIK